MHNVLEHPIAFLAVGGTSIGAGVWAMLQQGTILLGFIAALCGAITGVFGVYLTYRKWKKGRY